MERLLAALQTLKTLGLTEPQIDIDEDGAELIETGEHCDVLTPMTATLQLGPDTSLIVEDLSDRRRAQALLDFWKAALSLVA